MAAPVLARPAQTITPTPALATPAPTSPPIRACELLDGMPKRQVITFQTDSSHERAKDHARLHDVSDDNPGADGLRHVQAEEQESDEVEECRPDHGL